MKVRRKETLDAVHFLAHDAAWPGCVTPWDKKGYQPRDMSFGCCRTANNAEEHVFYGDWIVTDEDGRLHRFSEKEFQEQFEEVEERT